MNLIRPSFVIEDCTQLSLIEKAGRTCYKSESKMHYDSCFPFVKGIIRSGHESVIEHSMLSVRFIVDRGVTHELVRHRLVAFSQESTRYCNYSGGVTFIIPPWVKLNITLAAGIDDESEIWVGQMRTAESAYQLLLKRGWTPQQARSVLPNSLKTEIVATANFREWRHIFKLRALGIAGKPHPQMQEIMLPLLEEVKRTVPVIFDDLKAN